MDDQQIISYYTNTIIYMYFEFENRKQHVKYSDIGSELKVWNQHSNKKLVIYHTLISNNKSVNCFYITNEGRNVDFCNIMQLFYI